MLFIVFNVSKTGSIPVVLNAISKVALICLFLHQLMFSRPYSRRLEAEADHVGLQLAAKVSFFQFDAG